MNNIEGRAMQNWLEQLISDVIERPIEDDERTTATTFLGWPRNQIFRDVIAGGQADFDAAIGHLSGFDRARLYAKYNQGRHLDELRHAFTRMRGEQGVSRPTVIDVGCGPFTAGLAFAASFGALEPFRYFGVDRARSMLDLGELLATGAKERGAFHPQTTWTFGNDLDDFDFGPVRGEWTVVVASYLLASSTIDVDALVRAIEAALKRIGPGPVAVLYTNSANTTARAKFPAFRDALVRGGFEVWADDIERFVDTEKTPKDLHYALLFRAAQNTIPM
ncbi:class I SAM-dependent methyltransferase [Burkholderia sp. AU39826]|uniref:class I SAM-dependent methyltransferase n=1 Tax=Burkholderia sp. AU39826 TaxID=2879634 RepID=UPI001CF18D9D|nr:class I SAM-dependent methyltransferase [Burkholderia sp. AU39826]MCA7968372.1 class I SAM-dependent methyltransferase [Burkholderia sp. AU39826]